MLQPRSSNVTDNFATTMKGPNTQILDDSIDKQKKLYVYYLLVSPQRIYEAIEDTLNCLTSSGVATPGNKPRYVS